MAVRYAIVGSGCMGQEHIRYLQLLDGAEVCAIADPDEGMRAAAVQLAGDHHGSTFFQHQRFLDTIRTDARPEVSLDDGTRAVEIGAAAEQSVASGQPVLLSPGA